MAKKTSEQGVLAEFGLGDTVPGQPAGKQSGTKKEGVKGVRQLERADKAKGGTAMSAGNSTDENKLVTRPYYNPNAQFAVVSLDKAYGQYRLVLEKVGKRFSTSQAAKIVATMAKKKEFSLKRWSEASDPLATAAKDVIRDMLRVKAIKVLKA